MTARALAEHLLAIGRAGVAAVEPAACVRRHLSRHGDTLRLGTQHLDLAQVGRVWVVGAGKASASMALEVEALLGDRLAGGLVLVPPGVTAPLTRIETWTAAHPVSDQRSVDGTAALLELVAAAGDDDLVLVLISGGASALLCRPAEGLTADDLMHTHRALLASGLPITAMNTVRRHLSAIKGGWLAAHLHPRPHWSLVLSDVVGDDPSTVGSGPTAPDPTTFADALAAVEGSRLVSELRPAVVDHLRAGVEGRRDDTPKPGSPWFARAHLHLVGGISQAVAAAAREAARRGWQPDVRSLQLIGEAADVGAVVGSAARDLATSGQSGVWLFGGETTVTLGASPGRGGRNQELALAAAREIAGLPGVAVLALGTDGVDGPTDAAGGVVTGGTWQAIADAGLDPADHLRRHDSHPALDAAGALVRTGPTGTNVMDLTAVLVEPRLA